MYVPKAKLLIKYTDIREFKTIVHSTNGVNDSMKAEITDNFGIKYTVNIKRWKDFYIYRPLFLKDLDEKILKSSYSDKKQDTKKNHQKPT